MLVLHVGRVTPAKNHERLLSIFAALAENSDQYRLLIAGGEQDVSLADRLRSMVRRLELDGKVVFSGVRADVPRLLSAANIMIFPSTWEGLPGAVLEAAAAGVPVLASDIPGCLEITRHTDLLRCLSLQEPDSEWAAVAKLMLRERRSPTPSRSPLAGTVFDSELSIRSFEQMYAEALNCQMPTESIKETNGECSLP